MTFTNRLTHESSPYLLQHAHNPVDWYPWGSEALDRAKKENKPMLVSIGYAACHWCHVMERESFEDPETARLMNEHFVNIKIDREERPDLDHIYMDAVQAMTGSGGWPLNVFLTPEGKPFYGGTYFPPRRAFNRPSWQEVLLGVMQAFRDKRHEIDAQADNLTAHLEQSNTFGLSREGDDQLFNADTLDEIFRQCMKSADSQWGGFGKAPKFPQTGTIRFLMRYYHDTGDRVALDQAVLSLDRMLYGGIYDQIGGGFARYSTDTEWLVPHFEKMLYDNALLVSLYSEAYQLTGLARYARAVDETMEFVQRELMHPEKAFYAALDADSEGVEGKYYVWTKAEAEAILADDAPVFCAFYDITDEGNWEHRSIPWVLKNEESFAREQGISVQSLETILARGRKLLLQGRKGRVAPALDDKVILGWNALMNQACSQAFAATGKEAYRQLAIANMRFLLSHFRDRDNKVLHHTWKNGVARFPAFLDDHAYLISALLQLQEITGDTNWLDEAASLHRAVLEQFPDKDTPFYFYTPEGQADVIVRKKEVYDGATPSGNAIMALNAWRLGILLDRSDWKEQALAAVGALARAITRYPTSFAVWACLIQEMTAGTNEIAVCGWEAEDLHQRVLREYIPYRVIMVNKMAGSRYPLLAGKDPGEIPAIFLCRNYTCQRPVFSELELMSLINKGKNR